MPPGLPHRPPLAMKLWLSRQFSNRSGGTESSGHSSGRHMSIESLEHMVRNRVRMFLRHTWLVTILGTIAVGGLVWAGFYYVTEADHMRVAAGPLDQKFVPALSAQLAQNHHNLTLELVPTQNAKETVQVMNAGQADLAVLASSADDSVEWPAIAILRQNVIALIVPAAAASQNGKSGKSSKSTKSSKSSKSKKGGKSAKAKSDDDDDSDSDSDSFGKVTDLSGKRVGIVKGNEANETLLDLLLNHYGVPLAKVTVSEIDPKNVAGAVKNDQVDVLFVAGSATGDAISSTVAAATKNGKPPTFIKIDQADGIAKRNPAFDSLDIDAGSFGGNPPTPDADLKSLSFGELFVARKSYSESVVGTVAKVIYTSRQALAAAMPGEIKIEAPSTDKDGDVVVHPGALAYLNDNQQSFFDRYGDDIFYGLLIFPIFGSAIAGVASYLRNDTRTRRLRLLQRVLDLVRKAHSARDLATINRLQLDADNLVIAIIHQSEHEEFDETVRMSFAFALDQLRFAIAARRHAILDHSNEAMIQAGAIAGGTDGGATDTSGTDAKGADGPTLEIPVDMHGGAEP
jgi:TRAP-type uncharacterized transport system substrate-binding protein